MICTCSALRSLTQLSQEIVFFTQNPGLITTAVVNQLLSHIELIRGQVREFPIPAAKKVLILNELDLAAQILLQTLVADSTLAELLYALQILDVTRAKIEDLNCC